MDAAHFGRSRTSRPACPFALLLFVALPFLFMATTATAGKGEKGQGGGPHPRITLVLAAEPAVIAPKGFTTLVWDAVNAADCSAGGGWTGDKPVSGVEMVGPLVDSTIFTLQCGGSGKPAKEQVTVTVATSPPLPTVSLSADPSAVNPNDSSTLIWSSANADSCMAGDAWSGAKPTAGSEAVGPLIDTSTFTLTCTGPGGSASRPVTVTVQNMTGSADLSWIAPSTNEDGSPVSLTAFKVYRGSSPSSLQQIATVGANVTSHSVDSLAPGTHYFAVTATSATGESGFSNIENTTIP